MQIHQMIKDTMEQHKSKITITQWAFINAISSLIYSEYIKNIRQKQVPVNMILVPEIKYVEELLNSESEFIKLLSDKLIDVIIENKLFQKYAEAPELVLFKEENVEILKTIFDLYMVPNITRRIPEAIAKKFDLFNPDQQLIRQSREIDLFERKSVSDEQLAYIVEESILQLLLFLQTMKKSIEYPESNVDMMMTADSILTINHENALCPIHFNDRIINNASVIDLLSFVTNTTFTKCDYKVKSLFKNEEIECYNVKSNTFNKIAFTLLEGIEITLKEDAGV